MLKNYIGILCAIVLSSCAGATAKVDAALASPKTQQDVQWACMLLQGGVSIVSKIDTKHGDAYAKAQIVLGAPCQAAREGKLTNSNDLYVVVMDLAGQLAAEIAAKTDK